MSSLFSARSAGRRSRASARTAAPHAGGKRAKHSGRREVVGLRDGIDLDGGIGLRTHARRGVGEDDVHLAELGGKLGDRVAIAHVEHATLDVGDRRSVGDRSRGGRDASGISACEQDTVLRRHAGG
jgi:hypothetical protein